MELKEFEGVCERFLYDGYHRSSDVGLEREAVGGLYIYMTGDRDRAGAPG